jgi:hypothetical protein
VSDKAGNINISFKIEDSLLFAHLLQCFIISPYFEHSEDLACGNLVASCSEFVVRA